MAKLQYAIKLTADPEGGYVVTCRDLPELITQGNDIDNALAEASDAMAEVFAAYSNMSKTLPAPSALLEGEYLVSPA